MTKMTHRTNLIIVVKVIHLDTSRIYNHNHMVGMDKIFSSAKTFSNWKSTLAFGCLQNIGHNKPPSFNMST